jgi:cytosine/adenosine deaminase-related metal-dependent hydrolase
MRNFGWAHSLAHGGDIQKLLSRTPLEAPFIMHVCEGVDELAKHEIFELDRLSALNPRSVIVHGVALDSAGVALMCDRQASLILCMSSNYFLFGRIPDISLLQKIGKLAIGNDSPLTAVGDLLDEIRFAIEYGSITADSAYAMVTEASAALLRLRSGQGTIRLSAPADLIAVRDTGDPPAIRLGNLTWKDVEFVMVAGQVRLASDDVRNRLQPYLQRGLERLVIEGELRWVRAPIDALLQEAEEVLGKGNLHLAGRRITSSSSCDTISLAGWNA